MGNGRLPCQVPAFAVPRSILFRGEPIPAKRGAMQCPLDRYVTEGVSSRVSKAIRRLFGNVTTHPRAFPYHLPGSSPWMSQRP